MEAGKSPFQPHGTYVTPLLISMAGVAATSLVIMAYHLILVRFCMRDRANTAAAGQPLREEPVGVDEDLLNKIPVFSFSSKTSDAAGRSQTDRTECVVCLAELEEGEMVRSLPNCRHLFHVGCIDDWFSAHSNCPLCRSEIAAEPEPEPDVIGETEQNSSLVQQQCPESQGGAENNSTVADSRVRTPDVPSNVLLRHCVSLVLSREGGKRRLVMGLKRSLSMDHSYILVNLHGESEYWKDSGSSSSSSSSSSAAAKRGPYGFRSVRQLDRMSSRWLKSVWQLRLNGRRCNTVDGILPY